MRVAVTGRPSWPLDSVNMPGEGGSSIASRSAWTRAWQNRAVASVVCDAELQTSDVAVFVMLVSFTGRIGIRTDTNHVPAREHGRIRRRFHREGPNGNASDDMCRACAWSVKFVTCDGATCGFEQAGLDPVYVERLTAAKGSFEFRCR